MLILLVINGDIHIITRLNILNTPLKPCFARTLYMLQNPSKNRITVFKLSNVDKSSFMQRDGLKFEKEERLLVHCWERLILKPVFGHPDLRYPRQSNTWRPQLTVHIDGLLNCLMHHTGAMGGNHRKDDQEHHHIHRE